MVGELRAVRKVNLLALLLIAAVLPLALAAPTVYYADEKPSWYSGAPEPGSFAVTDAVYGYGGPSLGNLSDVFVNGTLYPAGARPGVTLVNDAGSVVVTDDDQESFWGYGGGGSGGIDISIANDTSVVKSGSDSLRIDITSGSYSYVRMDHFFSPAQDWSAYRYVAFWWHGQGTGARAVFYVFTPDWNNYAWFQFFDNFTGWRLIVFDLSSPAGSKGNYDLTNVDHIGFRFHESDGWSAGTTVYLDLIRLDYGGVYLTDPDFAHYSRWIDPASWPSTFNWLVDYSNGYFQYDFGIVNMEEETDPVVLADDGQTGSVSLIRVGTGDYDWVVSDDSSVKKYGSDALKIETVSGSYDHFYLEYRFAAQDWTGYDFIALWWYGSNSGLEVRVWIEAPDISNRRIWRFFDNFSGWKRIVIPIRWTGDIPGVLEFIADIGSPDFTNVQGVGIGDIYPTSVGQTWYLDRLVVDVGRWVKVEIQVPDELELWPLSEDGVQYTKYQILAWDPSAQSWKSWHHHDGANVVDYSSGFYWLDGTTQLEIYDGSYGWQGYGLMSYEKGETGSETGKGRAISISDDAPPTILYSTFFGTKYRVGFSVKMPPYSDYSGINRALLRVRVYFSSPDYSEAGLDPLATTVARFDGEYVLSASAGDAWLDAWRGHQRAEVELGGYRYDFDVSGSSVMLLSDKRGETVDVNTTLHPAFHVVDDVELSICRISFDTADGEASNFLLPFEYPVLNKVGVPSYSGARPYALNVYDYAGMDILEIRDEAQRVYYRYLANQTTHVFWLEWGMVYSAYAYRDGEVRAVGGFLADNVAEKALTIGIFPSTTTPAAGKTKWSLEKGDGTYTFSITGEEPFTVEVCFYNDTRDPCPAYYSASDVYSASFTFQGSAEKVWVKVYASPGWELDIPLGYGSYPAGPSNMTAPLESIELPLGLTWGVVVTFLGFLVLLLGFAVIGYAGPAVMLAGVWLALCSFFGLYGTPFAVYVSLIVIGVLLVVAKR